MNNVTLTWEPSGKPRLYDPASPDVDLSIAHDADFCLTAVGNWPQGCDLQAVDPRSRQDWLGLLGPTRSGYLDPLIAGGDTPDQAGTRLWAAAEASIKALGAPPPQSIRVRQRDGGAVLLEVEHPTRGPWPIFTSVVSLEPDRDHIIALALDGAPNAVPTSGRVEPLAGSWRPSNKPTDESMEGGCGALVPAVNGRRYVQAFQVLVRDVPKVLGSTYYPSFTSWMGASREGAAQGFAAEIEQVLRSGQGMLISRSVALQCFAPTRVGERIVSVLTTSAADWDCGPYTFNWAFHRGGEDGPLVARGSMQSVWVAPTGSNMYRVAPAPTAIHDFIASVRSDDTVPMTDAPPPILGAMLSRAGLGQSLASVYRDVDVSLEETDFQGHAHFVNYFRWEGMARDTLMRSLGLMIDEGAGVPMCLSSEMTYLREIRLFEPIRVVAEVDAAYANGVDLKVSFYRRAPAGDFTEKLAVSTHRMALVEDGGADEPAPRPLPAHTLQALGLSHPFTRVA